MRRDHRISSLYGCRGAPLLREAARRINALWFSASSGQKNIGQKTLFGSTTDQAKLGNLFHHKSAKKKTKVTNICWV
jgi:hypothetical protein